MPSTRLPAVLNEQPETLHYMNIWTAFIFVSCYIVVMLRCLFVVSAITVVMIMIRIMIMILMLVTSFLFHSSYIVSTV